MATYYDPKMTRLDRYELSIQNIIPDEMSFVKNHITIDIEKLIIGEVRSSLLKLKTYLLKRAHKQIGVGSYRFPATWWEHLKKTHFPAWLLARFPVKYALVAYEYETEIRLCPHANIAWPDGACHLDFLTYNDPIGE